MNCISGFSDSAIKALNAALGAAMGYGHTYIGSEHILYGLVSDDSLPTAAVLRRYGIGRNEVLRRLEETIGRGRPTRLSLNDLTPRSRKLIDNALSFASGENRTVKARIGDSLKDTAEAYHLPLQGNGILLIGW